MWRSMRARSPGRLCRAAEGWRGRRSPRPVRRFAGRGDQLRGDSRSLRALDTQLALEQLQLDHELLRLAALRSQRVPQHAGGPLRLLERLVICESFYLTTELLEQHSTIIQSQLQRRLASNTLRPRHHSRGPAVVLVLYQTFLAWGPARHCMPVLAVRGLPFTCWGCFVGMRGLLTSIAAAWAASVAALLDVFYEFLAAHLRN